MSVGGMLTRDGDGAPFPCPLRPAGGEAEKGRVRTSAVAASPRDESGGTAYVGCPLQAAPERYSDRNYGPVP